jgi:hypothetical protein
MDALKNINGNKTEFLKFLKAKYPDALFHLSNIFYRDLEHGVKEFFEKTNGKRLNNDKTEMVTKELVSLFEKEGIFKKVNPQGWVLDYPDFQKPKSIKKEP